METLYVETIDLSKEFKGERAVDAVNLHVRKHSIYGLLGPNGAGKSTLLKMLVGILRPSIGEILIEGESWKRSDLSAIGALIEQAPLYGNLTVHENLEVYRLQYDLPLARV